MKLNCTTQTFESDWMQSPVYQIAHITTCRKITSSNSKTVICTCLARYTLQNKPQVKLCNPIVSNNIGSV